MSRRRLGFALLACRDDAADVRRLLDSFVRNNIEELPLLALVPDADVELFAGLVGDTGEVIPESALGLVPATLEDGPTRLDRGAATLALWQLDRYDDYVLVDPRVVLLRPFGRADFMATPDVPFTFLSEDAELRVDPGYFDEHRRPFERSLRDLRELLGVEDARLLATHGLAVLSTAALAALHDDFLVPRGLSYDDAMMICPSALAWYSLWVQRSQVIPLVEREPIVKVLHHAGQRLEYDIKGVGEQDVARGYLGIIAEPGLSQGRPTARYEALASSFTVRTLSRALALRLLSRAPRVRRMLGLSAGSAHGPAT